MAEETVDDDIKAQVALTQRTKEEVVDRLVHHFDQSYTTLRLEEMRYDKMLANMGLPTLEERRAARQQFGISLHNKVLPQTVLVNAAYALRASELGHDPNNPPPAVATTDYTEGAGLNLAAVTVACNAFRRCWPDLCHYIQTNTVPLPNVPPSVQDMVGALGVVMSTMGAWAGDVAEAFATSVVEHAQKHLQLQAAAYPEKANKKEGV